MTAKEFLRNKKSTVGLKSQSSPLGSEGLEVETMIEFAKYHVQKALLKAEGEAPYHCSEGIKNCYPLENIK